MSNVADWMVVVALVIVLIALFFAMRRVVWWYFGIDRALDALERIDRRLARILERDLTLPPP